MPALGILAGTGYVSIVPDLTRFNSQLAAGVNSSLAGLSKSGKLAQGLSSIGSSLTKFVTLPLGIAGAASVKMALDFESSFAKIGALAGNLGVSLEEAKQHVLDLAGQTAQSPKELTDALYFVASAGLQADQVMSVLDASARGAAVGMGTASQIAQTLTSVLNAYAGTGLTAGNAMNIMTQAVKSGKAEMTDFATGLGPVIGVAAQAGVSFNDLAAAIAQATNLGLPFDRAVTGMRFLIQSLEAPLPKAVKALDSVGVSVSDLHAQLAQPGGLQTALQELAVKFDLSTEAGRAGFAAVVGGARGSVVAMDLVGKHTEQTNKIVRDLGAAAQDSSTVFEQAFAKVTGTSLFKAQAAIASFQASFTKLGIALLPIATKLIGVVTGIANAFAGLSPHAQTLAIEIGAIAFAAGPVLKIFGGLIGIGAKVAGIFTSIGAAAATSAASSVAAGAATSKLAFGFVSAAENAGAMTGAEAAAGAATGLLGAAAIAAAAGIGLLILKHKLDSDQARINAAAIVSLSDALVTGKTSITALAIELKNSAIPEWAKAALITDVLAKAQAEAARQVDAYRQQIVGVIGPLDANTASMVVAALAAGDYATAMRLLKAAADGFFASLGPMATAEQQAADAAIQSAVEHKGLALALGGADAAAKILGDTAVTTGGKTTALGDVAVTTGGKVKTIGDGAKTAADKLAALAKAFKPVADSLAANSDFVSSALAGMADQAKVSGDSILKAFDKALQAEINYKKNFEELVKRGLPAAFAQQLADMGASGAAVVDALANANSKDFKKIVSDWLVSQGVARDLANDIAGIGTKADGSRPKVKGLGTDINNLPKSHKTDITLPGITKGISDARLQKQVIDFIPKSHATTITQPGMTVAKAAAQVYLAVLKGIKSIGNIFTTITTTYKSYGTPAAGGSGIGGHKPIYADGAVFPKLATGGTLFRTPLGHEFLAGEGNYPTFLGQGTELASRAGVLPLTDRVIDRLGDRIGAVSRAHWVDDMNNMSSTTPMPRGGVRGRPIVIQVMVDRREIARAHANSAVWDN